MLPRAVLSPAPLKHDTEPHPILGIDMRCNSRRAVTRITPFQERVHPGVDFFYKPITCRPRVRRHPEGADKRRASECAAGGAFLAFALIQFRYGPLLCPHPALRGQGAPCPLPCFVRYEPLPFPCSALSDTPASALGLPSALVTTNTR
ncbi:hypothetical protein B0H15DRAFT_814186 [Mycena belliarum]|uniref:Uncharacterized protein n=1 Tax=Mycena belliarum TaxID=1033014 RepID=A0AAD6XTL6_9AGAR|nr:hypothetical protein B0H15DRAFT_820253 [Mycena belliae]KAJ7102335.1 hypothetical protein B0H15DRAFT_814186 [Mycena belliae]